jgi:glycosyltransferase involved in cell wall biosynthesis
VLFLGKTDYPPNKMAIETLLTEWIPAAINQGMVLHPIIVGGPDPPRTNDETVFTGYVKDVWPFLAAADVCVAPLRAGSGTRIKVLHYLAAGKPIIASGLAVEGLGLENGIHYLQANESMEFSSALRRVMSDDALRQSLVVNGREVADRFQWRTIADRWARTISNVAALEP